MKYEGQLTVVINLDDARSKLIGKWLTRVLIIAAAMGAPLFTLIGVSGYVQSKGGDGIETYAYALIEALCVFTGMFFAFGFSDTLC